MNRLLATTFEFVKFLLGWVLLGILGISIAQFGLPVTALLVVSVLGFICSVVGFRSLEMAFGMIVFIILGSLLAFSTDWAWVAPWLPGGFMVTVAIGSYLERNND